MNRRTHSRLLAVLLLFLLLLAGSWNHFSAKRQGDLSLLNASPAMDRGAEATGNTGVAGSGRAGAGTPSGEGQVAGFLSDNPGGDKDRGLAMPGVADRWEPRERSASGLTGSMLRLRSSPMFDFPGMVQKEFTPGVWLEITNTLRLEAEKGSVPFMIQLDIAFANGTFFRSTIEADSFEDIARIYLSPASLRRLSGEVAPATDDIVWYALTDLTGGSRTSAGVPSGNPPREVPFRETIRALRFGETPFAEVEAERMRAVFPR